MSNLSTFLNISKPVKTTYLTTGTGTFTPYIDGSWARITMCGGGAGGSRTLSYYPSASSTLQFYFKMLDTYSYQIGAGGIGLTTTGTPPDGGTTKFGQYLVLGGQPVTSTATVSFDDVPLLYNGSAYYPDFNSIYIGGGAGRSVSGFTTGAGGPISHIKGGGGTTSGSYFGQGGNGNNAGTGGNGTGYGAAGGNGSVGGGNGSNGVIIIEELGAW
jgi:hypothetical protein